MPLTVTRIEITISETQNLGDYSNIKPSVTIEARLDPADNPVFALNELIATASAAVGQQVDQALMRADRDPKYFTGPLYQVHYNRQLHLVLVVPASWSSPPRANSLMSGSYWSRSGPKLPLHLARERADRKLDELRREYPDTDGPPWALRAAEKLDQTGPVDELIAERQAAADEAIERHRQEAEAERQRQRDAELARRQAAAPPATAHNDEGDADDDE